MSFALRAIISKETWQLVQSNLKQNKSYASNKSKHFYLLKGKLRCSICNCNLYGKMKKRERVYLCLSKRDNYCGLRSVNIDKLNAVVWKLITNHKVQLESLKNELKSTDNVLELARLEKKKIGTQNQIDSAKKRRENTIILYEKNRITLDEFDIRSSSIESETLELNKSINFISNEIRSFKRRIELMEASFEDDEILKTINAWGDDEKRLFVNRKIRNIIVYWNPSIWQHIFEVTVEISGFFVKQYCAIVSANKPPSIHVKKLSLFEMQSLIGAILSAPHHGRLKENAKLSD